MSEPAATILVVDDDPDVLALASTLLELSGYNVIEAANALEALSLIQARAEIDLLFTDIVMPGGLNGFQLARQAREIRPDLRILYTSGYPRGFTVDEPAVGFGRLLPKPWRHEALDREIKSALA